MSLIYWDLNDIWGTLKLQRCRLYLDCEYHLILMCYLFFCFLSLSCTFDMSVLSNTMIIPVHFCGSPYPFYFFMYDIYFFLSLLPRLKAALELLMTWQTQWCKNSGTQHLLWSHLMTMIPRGSTLPICLIFSLQIISVAYAARCSQWNVCSYAIGASWKWEIQLSSSWSWNVFCLQIWGP